MQSVDADKKKKKVSSTNPSLQETKTIAEAA